MRANIPTDNDFENTQVPVDDTAPEQKITPEQRELAKIGNSADWQIILKYLDARIDVYKNGLFGENLAAQPTEVIGQRFLAAQSVIQEFESLKSEVESTTKAVNEVAKDKITKETK